MLDRGRCESCERLAYERDRAIETRENANAASVRVEAENRRYKAALERIANGHAEAGRLYESIAKEALNA